MTIDTQKLRELEAKATARPWHTKSECPGRCCWHVFKGLPMYGGKPFEDGDNADDPIVMGECSEDDAAFMVAIRNAAPALLDHIDALLADVDRLREIEENGAQAVRWAPSSAHWSNELLRLFGPDARAGIDALEAQLRKVQAERDALRAAVLAIDSLRGPFMSDDDIASVWKLVDAALAQERREE